MQQSLIQTYALTFVVAALAIVAFAGAIILEMTNHDSSKAWDAFAGFAVFFAGVHVPSPLSQ